MITNDQMHFSLIGWHLYYNIFLYIDLSAQQFRVTLDIVVMPWKVVWHLMEEGYENLKRESFFRSWTLTSWHFWTFVLDTPTMFWLIWFKLNTSPQFWLNRNRMFRHSSWLLWCTDLLMREDSILLISSPRSVALTRRQ